MSSIKTSIENPACPSVTPPPPSAAFPLQNVENKLKPAGTGWRAAAAAALIRLGWRMKNPVHRCRDVEHGRGQSSAGTVTYLQAEQRIPISKDVITSSSASAMWFIRDACGIICAVITWLLVFYAAFVVVFVMLLPSKNLIYSLVNGAIFNVLAFLALASHLRAMCTDPVSVYVPACPACVWQ